jgi:pimeloyl-ACP methyl ester carboxylesterase
MATFNLNQYKFYYEEAGNGESVVFVHGSTSDSRTWENQVREFGKHYRALTYSRRYHWPNTGIANGEDYAMPQHVDDLEALLEQLNGEPVHLIGHSYGAFVCLLLAMRSPQLVRSLVLAEPPIITLFLDKKPNPLQVARLLIKYPRTGLAMLRFVATGLMPAARAVKKGKMEKAITHMGKAILGEKTYHGLSTGRMEQVRDNMIAAELLGSGFQPLNAEKIRQLHVPTLLVYGDRSPVMFFHLQNRLHELLPDASQVIIEDASHIMHEDNPANYNFSVRNFLEKHGA